MLRQVGLGDGDAVGLAFLPPSLEDLTRSLLVVLLWSFEVPAVGCLKRIAAQASLLTANH